MAGVDIPLEGIMKTPRTLNIEMAAKKEATQRTKFRRHRTRV